MSYPRDGTGQGLAGHGTGRDGTGRDGTGRDGTGLPIKNEAERDGTGLPIKNEAERDGTGLPIKNEAERDGTGLPIKNEAERDGTGRDGTTFWLSRGALIATSGFTTAGYPKVILGAFAQRITASLSPENFVIHLYTGASTGDQRDGVLARTGRMELRIPYQSHSHPYLRKLINAGKLNFIDMHLNHVGRHIREGIFPPIDVALFKACDVIADSRIYLTNPSGMSETYLSLAKEIYIELSEAHPLEMKGLHDIYLPELHTGKPINIDYVDDRIGQSGSTGD